MTKLALTVLVAAGNADVAIVRLSDDNHLHSIGNEIPARKRVGHADIPLSLPVADAHGRVDESDEAFKLASFLYFLREAEEVLVAGVSYGPRG